MSAERDLVTRHFEGLLEAATQQGVPSDVVGRLLLEQVVALWLRERPAEDVAQELRFAIDHLGEDEDFPFMRP